MIIPEEYPATPNLDKALEIKERSQAIGEFLEWCHEKGWWLAEFPKERDYMLPIKENNIQKILAEFFGLDYEAMSREQEAVLKWVREHS
jgi:hypothetical protein